MSNILVMCVSSASQGCDEYVYGLLIVPILIRAGCQVSVECVMFVSSVSIVCGVCQARVQWSSVCHVCQVCVKIV